MNITIDNEVLNASCETIDIHIEFNPTIDEEENLAVYIATTVDLVKKYHRINELANNDHD